jgi:hypothetical protein
MFGSMTGHVWDLIIFQSTWFVQAPFPDSREGCRICPTLWPDMFDKPNSPTTKSLLTGFVQLILWILESFFPNISSPWTIRSAFSQLLSLGAPDLSDVQDRILEIFFGLVRFPTGHVRISDTPTNRFPMRAIKGSLCPPSLIWSLHWLANPLNLSFLSLDSLSQASIKSKPSRRDLSETLSDPFDLRVRALHQ